MKTFKVICAAAVLALSLSIPAYADGDPGDGHGPGKSTSDDGDISTIYDSTDSTATAGYDSGLATYAEILWALASIY